MKKCPILLIVFTFLAFTINAQTGNVGIGTTMPSERLEIKSPESIDAIKLSVTPAPLGKAIIMFGKNADTLNQAEITFDFINDESTQNQIQIGFAKKEPFVYLTGDEKMGIGIANPSAKLHVDGDANVHGLTLGRGNSEIYDNTALGSEAVENIVGGGNTGVGYRALKNKTTASRNTAVGVGVLSNSATGSNNVGVGWNALANAQSTKNIGIGESALQSLQMGQNNIAIGYRSLLDNLDGVENVAVGNYAGENNLGGGNVFLGYSAGKNEAGSDKLYIENSSSDDPLIYGQFDTDFVKINGSLQVTNIVQDDNLSNVLVVDGVGNFKYRAASTLGGGGGGSGHWTTNGNKIYNTNTGNVGINTSDPQRTFHVNGIVRVDDKIESQDVVIDGGSDTRVIEYINSCMSNGGDFIHADFWSCGNEFDFIDFRRGSFGSQFRVTQTGNVYADGLVFCREIEVSLSNFPDYVFENGYRLRPLQEVEQFINENGHLPNIPSAKEVEENGLGLGKMNKLLLEKIEELTLYAIEKEKEVNQLKEDLDNQKSTFEARLERLESMVSGLSKTLSQNSKSK